MLEFLFVYGSLRRYANNPISTLLATHSDYVSTGVMQGMLYEIAGYPGAVESDDANNRVFGEIYRLHNPRWLLAELDAYEECSSDFPAPHEYMRKPLNITQPDNHTIKAWVYIYNWDVNQHQCIPSGDYLANKVAGQATPFH